MVIVAGHITVDPEQRESYLAGCMSVVEKARRQMAASTLPSRPTYSTLAASTSFERCETQAAVETFRRSAPRNRQGAATRSVLVDEYDIADVRPLFGKGRA